MTQTADRPASPWSPREAELLAVTLELLQEHGYDGLTVDAVANTARASKATVYRRWPSKAELVLAAFIEGVNQAEVLPDTGTLRGDLLEVGAAICQHCHQQAGTIRAVLVEVSRHPALNDAFTHTFLHQRKELMQQVLRQAVERGEIEEANVTDELWDVLANYLIFRCIVPSEPPNLRTVQLLVDNFIIPGLTRSTEV
jgi:AcrR family transcriptional regulator